MKTITIGIPIQTDIEIPVIDEKLTEPFALRSLAGHSSELHEPFRMYLGLLERTWSSVFCESKIIQNEWLTAKYQHETWARKKVMLAVEMTKTLDIAIQFHEISL